jgi:hypothetical protein
MEDKITLASGLRWMRDKFGAWAANTTAFTFMWLSVAFAVAVLFVWDGVWATHQAPEGMELSYRVAGWALRIWVVFSLVGVVALYIRNAWGTASFLLLTWVLASIMTYGHAVGFMATGQMQRYASAQVVTDVETVAVSSVEEQNSALEQQIDGIRKDRDDDVSALERALNSELNDGNSRNDDAAREKYTGLITERRAKAQADIDALRQEVRDNLTRKEDAKTTAKEDGATVVAFDPLYIWISHLLHGRDATDEQIRTVAAIIGAFWAFLVEMLAGAGPAILYAAHAHFAKRSDMPENEETVRVSKDRLAELEEREANAKQAGKKAARTRRRGNKIEQSEQYARDKISQFMELKQQGMATSEIAKRFGLTVSGLKVGYENWMTPEEYDFLFNSRAVAVVKPEPEPEEDSGEVEPDSDNQDDDEGAPLQAAE